MTRRTKQVPKVEVNEPLPIGGRIAWHLENALVRFFKRVFNAIADPVKNLLSYAIEETIDVIEDFVRDVSQPFISSILDNPAIPDSLKHVIKEANSRKEVGAAVFLIPLGIAALVGISLAVLAPFMRLAQYAVEQVAESYRPDPATLTAMKYRQATDRADLDNWLNELGLPESMIKGYEDITRYRLPVGEWINNFLRGKTTEGQLVTELQKRGMTLEEIKILTDNAQIIPGPGDLVRMAVREAWNDTAANLFGYDEDYPAEFGEWAAKIGLSPDWSKKFWRAHWELPGVREGFEMLHRRIIEPEELELLLKVKDIPSFWRKSLIQLSYNPYTRVDVRRMFAMHVVSPEEVLDNYKDLGYDQERAEKLTEWTLMEYGESSRDLTKGDVIAAHTDNTITDEEAAPMLSALGYDKYEISILLARSDLKKTQRYEKEYVENVRVAYVGKQIERGDVIGRLNQLNPPSGFVEERLTIWDLQRERDITLPTKADLKALIQADIIDENMVRIELVKRNYEDYVINWYLRLWGEEE